MEPYLHFLVVFIAWYLIKQMIVTLHAKNIQIWLR